jgi:hypothetical protein
MLTSTQIAAALGAPEDKVAAALANVDQDAIQKDEDAAVQAVLWDQTSPINGVEAAKFLAREDVAPGGAIYLINDLRAGQTVYFQPHTPHDDGLIAMTADNWNTYAEPERQRVVIDRANRRTLEAVAAKLAS